VHYNNYAKPFPVQWPAKSKFPKTNALLEVVYHDAVN